MRFFSPLSGMGQMNFPVAPMDHMSRTRVAAAASGGSDGPNIRFAASPAGSRKMRPRSASRSSIIQLTTGSASRQKPRSEEHTSELQSRLHLVCRLLLEKKKKIVTHEQTATGAR